MSDSEDPMQVLIKEVRRLGSAQQQTNQLLMMLIDALSEEDPDSDDEPVTYLDGTLVAGGR